MPVNCIIVDDEPLARKGLAEYVAEVPFLELKAQCESALAANEVLNTQKIDLVLLDIQMPKMSGIEFLKTMRDRPMVIFTTAFTDYALQGYELDVIDYLVKPISFERFLKAANKAREFYEAKVKTTTEPQETYFFVRCDNRYEKIYYDELLFVEALENYVILQTRTHKYISYLTFKSVEEYLPGSQFVKVHKSFIIAASKIDNIVGNEIKMGGHTIPISRNLKEALMNKIVNGKLLKR